MGLRPAKISRVRQREEPNVFKFQLASDQKIYLRLRPKAKAKNRQVVLDAEGNGGNWCEIALRAGSSPSQVALFTPQSHTSVQATKWDDVELHRALSGAPA